MPQAEATPRTQEKSDATAVPQVVQTLHDRFGDPKNFINRELSWLAFNRRVLEEAQDPTQPLIERVKFVTIFSSNLDEFFEIRVAGIKQQIESETSDVGPDGLSPTELFDRIQKTVASLWGRSMRFGKTSCCRSWQERDLRARDRGVVGETHCLGKSLFSAGSFPNADAAGRGRQSSIPASVEPQPQSAGTSEDAASRRAAARHCSSAARCAEAYPHASRQPVRTSRGNTFIWRR
jgi:Polyphosphate kinase